MTEKRRPTTPKAIWAYAYEMLPPQPEDRLQAIQTLLDSAHADALDGTRTWSGRFVLEQQVTHILVVSDGPEEDGAINERIEAGLRELDAAFARTAPMIVAEGS
jgi:hypothetical protein